MAKPGPKPRPMHLKVAEGGVRESRINRQSPIPPENAVCAPRELSAGAKRHWDHLYADLVSRRIVTHWDSEVLARYCEWCDRYELIQAELGNEFVVEGRLGGDVKNPRWQLLRDCSEQINKLGAVMGLNPADRSRISVDDTNTTPTGPERLLS